MFSKKGLIAINAEDTNEDELMELALSAGADDMEKSGELFEITCAPEAYDELKKALEDGNIPTEAAQLSMVPQNYIPIEDPEKARKIMRLVEEFEDHDDVQKVYANFDISDEIMESLE